MSKLNVLFPIETINRELDYRIFLAISRARPESRIFIGQHDAIFRLTEHARGGVYLGKHIFRSLFPIETGERYRTLKNRGFKFIHLHEEGAVFYGGPREWEDGLRKRLDASILDAEDHICNWGDFQRDYYREQGPQLGANCVTTGHPRFDLCGAAYREYFEEDVERFTGALRPFILVNTNLSVANSGLGLADTFSPHRAYVPADATKRTTFIDGWAHHSHTLVEFVRLINALAARFPQLNLVIRPHPSEDREFYRAIFGGVSNVRVIHEGSVTPWLFGCTMMLHDGCTTGLEAHLAGKKIVNYKAVTNTRYDCFLPNLVGTRCTEHEEVFAEVERAIAGGDSPNPAAPEDDNARALLQNFVEPAMPKVLDVLGACEDTVKASDGSFDERAFLLADAVHRGYGAARSVVRPLFAQKMRSYRLHHSMFYGFERAEIERRVARAERLLKKSVRVRYFGPELFSIESA